MMKNMMALALTRKVVCFDDFFEIFFQRCVKMPAHPKLSSRFSNLNQSQIARKCSKESSAQSGGTMLEDDAITPRR